MSGLGLTAAPANHTLTRNDTYHEMPRSQDMEQFTVRPWERLLVWIADGPGQEGRGAPLALDETELWDREAGFRA